MTQDIKRKALELGYTACGVIPSASFDGYIQRLDERVDSFPESQELYRPLYRLAQPPENSKSIIVCTWRYNRYKLPEQLDGVIGKLYLFETIDPSSRDYGVYEEFQKYLETLGINTLKGYIPARWVAAKAGVGKFGRNNFIYDPEHGSYVWIDAWSVDAELDYDAVPENTTLPECKENCLKCVEACPTKALSGEVSMDRGKCVTQMSYFSKGVPPEDIRTQMGAWLYGCDACQDACPLNKDKFTETEELPLLSELEKYLEPENILEMDTETYINVIYPQFRYPGKDGLWRWKCNALRSMINSGNAKYHHLIKQRRDDPDERIREVAEWGCKELEI